jgi:hypothetical protein
MGFLRPVPIFWLISKKEKNRAEVFSDLHAQIQDACNEFGALIMSPHFESQPEESLSTQSGV